MWKKIGALLAKAATWCMGHPEEVIKVVSKIKKK